MIKLKIKKNKKIKKRFFVYKLYHLLDILQYKFHLNFCK